MRALLLLALLTACSSASPKRLVPDAPEVKPVGVWMRDGRVLYALLRPITWSFGCDYPFEDRDNVRAAFAYWDDLTPAVLFEEIPCVETGSNPQVRVVSVDGFGTSVDKNGKVEEHPTWWAACTQYSATKWAGSLIEFYKTYHSVKEEPFRQSIARHEVGHALMFKHMEDTACVMYRYFNSGETAYKEVPKALCEYELNVFLRYYGGPEGVPVR